MNKIKTKNTTKRTVKANKTTNKNTSGYKTIMPGIQQMPSGKYRVRFSMNGTKYCSPAMNSIRACQIWRNKTIKNTNS